MADRYSIMPEWELKVGPAGSANLKHPQLASSPRDKDLVAVCLSKDPAAGAWR